MIDDAFIVFQRRLGLRHKSSLHSSPLIGSRLLRVITVLLLASLLTPVACLVVAFARHAARRRLDQLSRSVWLSDGGLAYQRVYSVSSIVDSRRPSDLRHDVVNFTTDLQDVSVI